MESHLITHNSSIAIVLCGSGECIRNLENKSTTREESVYFVLSIVLLELIRPLIVPVSLWFVTLRLWTIYVRSTRDRTSSLPLPPGKLGLPFLGETLHLLFWEKSSFFVSRREKYGQIYTTHVLGNPTVRVIGPDNIRHILKAEKTSVTSQWPTSTCKLLGPGSVSMASGESHVAKKRMIMKAFTCHALSGYAPTIQTITQQYIRGWTRSELIKGYPELKLMVFEMSCRIFFGFHMDRTECERLLCAFMRFTSNIFSVPVDLPGFGFRKGLRAKRELLDKIKSVVRARAASQETGSPDVSALGYILNSVGPENLSDEDVEDICVEFLFASQASTASAACFLISKLANNHDIRQRIQEELTSHDVIDENVHSFQTLNRLTYVNNVVKEVLRMAPPIGGFFRKVLQTIEINGYQIPKDWTIVFGIRDTHETCASFQNSADFDPDRWNNIQPNLNSSYLPFGGGRRACAGKDLARLILKIVAVELARSCDVSLVNKNGRYSTFPVVEPLDDLPLVITPLCK